MRNTVLIFMLIVTALVQAQTVVTSGLPTGVEGTVTDSTGAVLVGATVVARNSAGESKTAVTDSGGKFRITGLTPGKYDVSITAKGFAEFKTEGLNVASAGMDFLDIQLQPAATSTNVNVEAQRVAQVETENAAVSGTITQQQIVSLGLNGRNFSQLIALAPGVSNQTNQDEAKVGVLGSAKYSVNGGRVEYNTFDVDSSDVLNTDIAASHGHSTLIVYPSLDAIEEMKILTSNYGAEYGRSASGTVLVTTKSGGREFHGNAYWFIRNEFFNARNYFDPPGEAPLYRRNDFGFTLGGPVFIPNHYNVNKNKTFFFFSEEVRRERSPTEFNQAVPSLAERGWNPATQSYGNIADFSDVCPPPTGANSPLNVQKYPDCPALARSTSPQTLVNNQFFIDPTAKAILQTGLIPLPNSTTGCNSSIGSCYVSTVSLPTSWREELVRLDHNFTSTTRLSTRFVDDHWVTTTPVPQWENNNETNSFPSVLNDFVGPGLSGVAHLTSAISSTFLNDFSVGITWQHITLADEAGSGVSLSRMGLDSVQYPMGQLFDNGFGGKLPAVVIAGNNAAYGGTGFIVDTSYMPWFHKLATLALRDDISKVVGKHTFQFGAQYVLAGRKELGAANGANSGDVQGVLTFSNIGSYYTLGNSFADFLYNSQGLTYNPFSGENIRSFQQDNTQPPYKVRYWLLEPYLQDNWRVSQRFTLNLGIRFSLFGNWQPVNQTLYNWEPSAYNPNLIADAGISINALHGYLQNAATSAPIPFDANNLNSVMTNGLVQCGTKGVPASCQSSHVFNPAPRIGFAWDPTGKGKTSIRAGYGIFFEHGTGSEANAGSLMGNAPQVLSMTENYPTTYWSIGSYGVVGSPNYVPQLAFPLNMVSIPTKTKWPYVQQWSLGVQQQIARDTTATLSYVGSKGTHLAAAMQINQLPPVPSANNPFGPGEPITQALCLTNQINPSNPYDPNGYFTLPNGTIMTYQSNPAAVLGLIAACDGTQGGNGFQSVQFDVNVLRPYRGVGNILAIYNVANSIYHSMQFTLRHHHGPLDLAVSYTYSHSIDDSSDRYESTFVNAYDLAANRASSDFDQRHLLNVAYIYRLPLLRLAAELHKIRLCDTDDCSDQGYTPYDGPSSFTRAVLGGWELSGITIYQTGTPFSIINDASATGISVLDNAGLALSPGPDSYPDVVRGNVPCNTAGSSIGTVGPLLGNPCMFVAPRGLTQGNAGRNFMNNPSRTNFDMALLRNFKVLGERTLQFRAEAFNVFNSAQFRIYDPDKGNTASNTISCYGDASTNYSAGAPSCLAGNGFLHPVDAHRPRTMQFGLKFQF